MTRLKHDSCSILGQPLDSMPPEVFLEKVEHWTNNSQRGYITFCNVHMLMEAHDDPKFQAVLKNALLNVTDGMPLVRILRLRGLNAYRLAGPDMMPRLCKLAAEMGWPIGLYGGSDQTLNRLNYWLKAHFPEISIGCQLSPPFRLLSNNEQINYINQINESGVKLLFVGLGCPKQEKWMAKHVDVIDALMFGVGGAFSMVSGEIQRAPTWMQKLSMEWLFRFSQEPTRLWRRYIVLNFRFLFTLIFSNTKS